MSDDILQKSRSGIGYCSEVISPGSCAEGKDVARVQCVHGNQDKAVFRSRFGWPKRRLGIGGIPITSTSCCSRVAGRPAGYVDLPVEKVEILFMDMPLAAVVLNSEFAIHGNFCQKSGSVLH
jgi:hypothetical protein